MNNNKYIEEFEKILNGLNKIILNKEQILSFSNIVDKLYYNISDLDYFFEVNKNLIKKLIRNKNIFKTFEHKIISDDFISKINDTPDKFIKWLLD